VQLGNEEKHPRPTNSPQFMRVGELADHGIVARRFQVGHHEAEERVDPVPGRAHVEVERHEVVAQVVLRFVIERGAVVSVVFVFDGPGDDVAEGHERGGDRAPLCNRDRCSDRAGRLHDRRRN